MNFLEILFNIDEIKEKRGEIDNIKIEIFEKIEKHKKNINISDIIYLYTKIATKIEIINILKKNNYENLIELNKKYPSESYSLMIEFDLKDDFFEQVKINTEEIQFLSATLEKDKKCINIAYELTKKVKYKEEYFIFFCDRFGMPANTIEIIRAYKKNKKNVSELNLIKILEINKTRNNIKFIGEYLENIELFRNKKNLIKYIVKMNSQVVEFDFGDKIKLIIDRFIEEDDVIHKDFKYYSLLKNQKVDAIKLYEIYKNNEENIEEFLNRIISNTNPDVFEKLIQSMETNGNYESAHKLCLKRLSYFPNSLIVIQPLVRIFGKFNNLSLALNLQKKANAILFRYGSDMIEAKLASKIGDWKAYQYELLKYYKYIDVIGGGRPSFAISEMFFIDAAPDIDFDIKKNLYKLISESKNIRKTCLPSNNKNKRIGIFSGDLRKHAMYPFTCLLLESLKNHDFEVHIFNTAPENLDDDNTLEIKKNYTNFYNINAFNNNDLDLIRSIKLDAAFDLSQHTSYNALNYFKVGISNRQITAFWASGFSTGMNEFDEILLDEFSFKNVTNNDLVERPINIKNALMVKATQIAPKKEKKLSNIITVGIFCRPNRLNDHIFNFSAKIANEYGYKFIYDHYQANQPDVKNFIKNKFLNAGMPEELISIRSDPLLEIVKEVHIALDSFPANSPTTTRDLIYNNVPVVTLCGQDPYSRFSASFLQGLKLEYLISHDLNVLFDSFKFVSEIRENFLNCDIEKNFNEAQKIAIYSLTNYLARLK